MIQDVAHGALGLRQFVPPHAPGSIQNDVHVLGRRVLALGHRARGEQEQEVAVLAGVPVTEEVGRHFRVTGRVVKAKVGGRRDILVRIDHERGVGAFAGDGDVVARRVDVLQRGVRGDVHLHAHAFQRAGREALGAERVHVAHQAAVACQYLAVLDLDALLTPGGNREDAGAEGVLADVLEEGGILPAPYDVLVDAARLVRVEHLGLQPRAVHPHGKGVDARPGRQGEDIVALKVIGALVHEHLVDARHGDLSLDRHRNVMVLDGQAAQRHVRPLDGRYRDDDAVGEHRAGHDRQDGQQAAHSRQDLVHRAPLPSLPAPGCWS